MSYVDEQHVVSQCLSSSDSRLLAAGAACARCHANARRFKGGAGRDWGGAGPWSAIRLCGTGPDHVPPRVRVRHAPLRSEYRLPRVPCLDTTDGRTVSAPINAAGGDVWRGGGGAQLPTGVPCCLASACVPPSVISSFDANNTPQGLVRDTPACWRGRVTHVRRKRGEARRSRGAALDTRSSVNAPL